jgi:uncharacterized protein (DUF885 family)
MMNRREALAALASTAALPLITGCSEKPASSSSSAPAAAAATAEADAIKLLDSIGENYVQFAPDGATSLGVDTGARAALRSQLTDRSAGGQKHIADQVRKDLDRAKAILNPDQIDPFNKFLNGQREMQKVGFKMAASLFGQRNGN